MEISFCELRCKEVINIIDGKSLGHIIDMVIDTKCAKVIGIVVPNEKSFFNFFKTSQDIFIPYNRICKIGKDVILVQLSPINNVTTENKKELKNKNNLNYEEINNFNYESNSNHKNNDKK